jgi:3-polyprenyl-4-hydroxybenzoate decarboxylase
MVKLRVAVRVISEDEYLQNVERAAHVPIKGEKRLLVIVREPHRWQIGALALEVQRAYKSCYQQ